MLDEIIIEIFDENGRLREVTLQEALVIGQAQAFAEDRTLGLKRNRIPFKITLLPDTPQTYEFMEMAQAIRAVAFFDVAPDNHNQGLWMRCVLLYWEAKATLLSNKILKLIPDPTQPGGSLHQIMPTHALEELQIETDLDKALYDLLKAGESQIQAWATAKSIDYPFANYQQLFIHILKARFERNYQQKAFSLASSWPDKKSEQKHHRQWLKFFADQFNGDPIEQEYIKVLMNMGWEGYPFLALRPLKRQKPFTQLWQTYLKTHRASLRLLNSALHWKNSIPHQTKQTSQKAPIQGILTDDGYIDWVWR